jgi:HTH-type transcriptional regulator / antitoxin MqsA
MGSFFKAEVAMEQCHVCGSNEFNDETVDEVFHIAGQPVLVENIPARVCQRCGESIFSRETTEQIRRMLHGEARPVRSVRMDVYAYP